MNLDETMTFQPRIDSRLWNELTQADEREEYCRCWLAIQCSMLANVRRAIIVLSDPEKETFTPRAMWPEQGKNSGRLTEVAERVLEEQCGLLVELEDEEIGSGSNGPTYGMAYPIFTDGRFYGLVALEISANSEDHIKRTMDQLQWGASWMEVLLWREKNKESTAAFDRLKASVDMLADVLSEENLTGASLAFVTELATRLECDRISLGFVKNKRVKIQAVSHSSRIADNMNLIRRIAQAMEEAVTQGQVVFYPPRQNQNRIVRDHDALFRQHGAANILTIPCYDKDRYTGVITLERSKTEPFTDFDAIYGKSIASLILPVLEIMGKTERSILRRFWDGLRDQVKKIIGPENTGKKLIVLLMICLAVFFYTKEGDYKISAKTVLEGAVKRVTVSPFEGYIKGAYVKAGDFIKKDATMCVLDDREYRLERLNWISKTAQYQKQYQEALAKHERAEAKIIKAQLNQAAARLELAESQLERTIIRSPFEGLVLNGDLSQRLGGSVSKGEILFEVAPLDNYRIILEVDERRIADVSEGQKGQMILSALPNGDVNFIVEKITPITRAGDGLNYFRVEAKPSVVLDRMRPGMEGIGKIYVDRRNLFSIWTRNIREWFKIKFWEYLT
ncbi:efflux RND transporter periplasmic adaptor subunit [uncultured Desulfobacter sp.]|uniref:efflux RND transporter periplasmic adaptor subunit n=1 Tax=uncultured Desulfobacter sp. TaxID=240139 RepID=UPI002AA7EE0E|nr:efflux RND transporter periplasmic adaptor subunit [uncultured Desulfobacter sp.]